jgi:hypothetical protein
VRLPGGAKNGLRSWIQPGSNGQFRPWSASGAGSGLSVAGADLCVPAFGFGLGSACFAFGAAAVTGRFAAAALSSEARSPTMLRP